jgi:hypothetical protein
MPLSDREQRVLDDIEEGLQTTDRKLAVSLVEHQPRSSAFRILALTVGAITAGLVLVLTGLVLNLVIVSLFGFLVIVGSIVRVADRHDAAKWIREVTSRQPPSGNRPR